MEINRINSPVIITPEGQSFSAVEITGDGFDVVNAAEERDSTGQLYPAGSQSVISVRPDTGSTINASYIKSGVIDANLMRAGLIQTVPSWNTKWYGAPADHAAVQIGFTGGSIAATGVSTGSGTVSLTLPGGHGLTTGDYVRVSGLYFTTGTLLGGVGLNLPTNGPVDYASATVSTNTLTYSKSDITSGLTASTASTVYVGKVISIDSISRVYDDPENPAELSTVTVTTSTAHGFAAGDYVEIAGTVDTMDGVAYVVSAPTSTTFTFKQRFGDNLEFDGTVSSTTMPTLGAPVAIKVLKAYTQNADGSIHITAGTVDSTLIVGEIAATEITIGSGESVVRVGSYPDAVSPTFQGIWGGASNPSSAEFSLSTAGYLTAVSGVIGGFTIGSTSLTAGSGATTVALDSGGTNPAIYAGSSTPSGAPFQVSNTGVMNAVGATIADADISNLEVTSLKMAGAIQLGADTQGNLDAIRIYDRTYTPAREIARWDTNGIQLSDTGLSTSRRISITGEQIELIDADGNSIVALSPDGVNASSITSGALPGGSNLIPNSSFELAPFNSTATTYIQATATGTAVNGDAPTINGTTPFSASLSMTTYS